MRQAILVAAIGVTFSTSAMGAISARWAFTAGRTNGAYPQPAINDELGGGAAFGLNGPGVVTAELYVDIVNDKFNVAEILVRHPEARFFNSPIAHNTLAPSTALVNFAPSTFYDTFVSNAGTDAVTNTPGKYSGQGTGPALIGPNEINTAWGGPGATPFGALVTGSYRILQFTVDLPYTIEVDGGGPVFAEGRCSALSSPVGWVEFPRLTLGASITVPEPTTAAFAALALLGLRRGRRD